MKGLMFQVVLQAFCISLFTLGICFVTVELRSRLDRNFLQFGAVIILLTIFSSIDLWMFSSKFIKRLLEIQHVIFCPIPYLIFIYLSNITKIYYPRRKVLFFYWSIICSVLFISGVMFQNKNGLPQASIYYYILFVPLLLISVYTFMSILFRAIRLPSVSNKFFIKMHIAAFIIFTIFGTIDLIRLMYLSQQSFGISYTIIGAIILGIILTYIFTENLIVLIKDRLSFIEKLQTAYKELESARDLSELGKSTSIINHEIKNYCSVIKGYAEILYKTANLDPHHQTMVLTILSSIEDMSRFSKEILDFSKAKTINNRSIPIITLIKSCIENKFYDHQDAFIFSDFDKNVMIYGDWIKLEHVFINLFTNALEAGASLITLRTITSQRIVLITIEDNGTGCTKDNLPQLFSAFFSTKDHGTGLGLATTRSIVEGHGGHISVVSKNVISDDKDHGCIFSITFPNAVENSNPEDIKDKIVLIENNMPQLSSVITTFRNVRINPYIIADLKDFDQNRFKQSEYKIIGSAETIRELKDKCSDYHFYTTVETSGKQLFIVDMNDKNQPKEYLFTDETAITCIAEKSIK